MVAAGERRLARVLRGGSWNNNPNNLRAANRNNNTPTNRNNNNGFRCSSTAARGFSRGARPESRGSTDPGSAPRPLSSRSPRPAAWRRAE